MKIKELLNQLIDEAQSASSEDDLREGTEHRLRNYFERWKINYSVKYEAGKKFGLVEGRIDSLWGKVVIEYEHPKTLHKSINLEHAKKQTMNYIRGLAKNKENLIRFRGITYDGYKICFCKWNENKNDFEWEEYDIDEKSLNYFLGILKISSKKAFHLEYLLKDFGFESKLALDCIIQFYELINKTNNAHTKLLFNEWKRLFGKIYGYDKSKFKRITTNIQREIKHFKIKDEEDVERLFFSIHTYYAFVVKLIAAEIAVSAVEDISESYIDKLSIIKDDNELKKILIEIENGGKFRQHGIHNFLETDFFSWYLDMWNNKVLVNNIRSIIFTIRVYEPNTVKLEPSQSRDLLKFLYQGIVPKCFRHDLGEYYTPDWLADYITKKTTENLKIGDRLLDPGCGSGTFLIFFIRKLKEEFFKKHDFNKENKAKLLEIILNSVVGIDLNPLAVITSRTNYLIAIADLLEYRQKDIILPVYLADSIITPHETVNIYGKKIYQIKSSLKVIFEIPEELVKKSLLEPIMEDMELYISNNSSLIEFNNRIRNKFPNLKKDAFDGIEQLFNLITSLEKKDQDRIWCRVLRNEFAPLFIGRFSYVIGNPPWISWESLPEYYKKEADIVFSKYGLIAHKGFKARIGFGRYDISMAFVYVSIDKYLEERGKLGFLITQSVFQSDPGEGFRKFSYGIGERKSEFKIKEVYDLTSFQPFEDASTRTSFFFAEKNKKTEYPIPYYYWYEKEKLKPNEIYDDVKEKIIQEENTASPIEKKSIVSKWFIAKSEKEHEKYMKLIGQSDYKALTGAYSEGTNGVYFIDIVKIIGDELLIRNNTKDSKLSIPVIEQKIESEFVYPLLKSINVKKWQIIDGGCILFLPKSNKNLRNIEYIKSNFPKTYKYLLNFESILKNRPSYINKYKGLPFYLMYGSEEMYSNYKVVWCSMGKKINAAVATKKQINGASKIYIPEHVNSFVNCKSLEEAHYLCGVINSEFTLSIVQKYSTVGGKSFASTHILKYVKIPKFNSKNKIHNLLAELSKEAHRLVKENKTEGIINIENKIEEEVKKLFI
jgi:hypothetical protein